MTSPAIIKQTQEITFHLESCINNQTLMMQITIQVLFIDLHPLVIQLSMQNGWLIMVWYVLQISMIKMLLMLQLTIGLIQPSHQMMEQFYTNTVNNLVIKHHHSID